MERRKTAVFGQTEEESFASIYEGRSGEGTDSVPSMANTSWISMSLREVEWSNGSAGIPI
jgi:hypothetical protein